MKLTNKQIDEVLPNLQKLAVVSLPIKIAFYIGMNLEELTIAGTRYAKAYDKLLSKYAEVGEDGKRLPYVEFDKQGKPIPGTENRSRVLIKDENDKAFQDELEELSSAEVDLKIYIVDIAKFGDNVNVQSQTLSKLGFMITDSAINQN